MNKAFELIAVLMISLVIGVQSLVAASVKGRILQMGPTGELTPVAGATLTTYTNKSGRSYPVTTDSEGMFYLTAPAGAYVLEVWTSRDPHQPPQTFPIKVTDPFTDIQSIILAGTQPFLRLEEIIVKHNRQTLSSRWRFDIYINDERIRSIPTYNYSKDNSTYHVGDTNNIKLQPILLSRDKKEFKLKVAAYNGNSTKPTTGVTSVAFQNNTAYDTIEVPVVSQPSIMGSFVFRFELRQPSK